MNKFKEDAFKECSLKGHSKANKVYQLAWDKDYISGLLKVFRWLEKLDDLVL